MRAHQGGRGAARRSLQVSARGRRTRLRRSSPDPTRGGGTPVTGRGGGRWQHCDGGERDGRAAEPHRPPQARGWGGTAATRVGSPRGRERGEPGIRGQGRRRAPRLPAPGGGGGSRAVTCGGSGGGGGGGSRGRSIMPRRKQQAPRRAAGTSGFPFLLRSSSSSSARAAPLGRRPPRCSPHSSPLSLFLSVSAGAE